jgi:tetratricopeptide (TPR) repeat protein
LGDAREALDRRAETAEFAVMFWSIRSPIALGSLLAPAIGLAGMLSLTACASTSPVQGAATSAVSAPARDESSPYGLFLAGEAALNNDYDQAAADYFTRAGAADDSALVRQKAFLAAVASGDVERAAILAPPAGEGPAPIQKLGQLTRAVAALADGRGKDAAAAMAKDPGGSDYVGGYQLVKPWAALAGGNAAQAVLLPDTQGQRLNRLAAVLGRSLIYERLRRYDEAETGYKALTSSIQLGVFYVLPYGAFLERRGRWTDAVALYKRFLARSPVDKGLNRALTRASARGPAPPLQDIKQGAGQALVSAAELALVQKSEDEGEIYLRLGLKLDPQNDEAWLLLGDLRAAAGEYEQAREDYAKAPLTADTGLEVKERIITSYQNAGDHDTALALARDLVKTAPNDRGALLALADALRETSQNEESARVLSQVLAAEPNTSDWSLYFLRGAALSEAGHWPEAEKDLLKALTLQPDQPDVLNFLGYSWVEKDQRLDQALSMLQKALNAEPQSGEIADSLGWAYYHMGDYHAAVLNLERAVTFNAVSPEINDHLGDAYWRVGRKIEAQYQWRRVLSLQPSADLKASAEKKLSSGLQEPIAPSAVAQG